MERAPWIPALVYDALVPTYPKDWSTQLERETFVDYPTSNENIEKQKPRDEHKDKHNQNPEEDEEEDETLSNVLVDDPRFSAENTKSTLDDVLKAADLADAELDRQEEEEKK